MRPDILLIEGMSANQVQAYQDMGTAQLGRGAKRDYRGRTRAADDKQAFRDKCQIHIIEVGYTSNTRYHEKMAEKNMQHDMLIAALRKEGWKVCCHVVVLGTGGFIFKNTSDVLEAMQVPQASRATALAALHRVHQLHEIRVCRRKLEREPG